MKKGKEIVVEQEIEVDKFSRISKQVGFNYFTIIAQILLAPLLVALLTRTLTVSEYGVYSLLMVFVFFAISFLELGFSQFIITKLSAVEDLKRAQLFGSILKFEALLIAGALVIFVFSPLAQYFLGISALWQYMPELRVGAVIIFVATLVRLFNSYFKATKHINVANTLDLVFNKGWALLLLVVFAFSRKFTLMTVFQIWLAGALIALLISVYYLRNELIEQLKAKIDMRYIKGALYFSIPLILMIISNWFIAMSNRYVLNFYTTTAVVGIFSVAYSLMGVVTTFSTTISQVIQPYFTEAFSKKAKHDILINASLKYSLFLVIPATTVAVVWREQIILLISGAPYIAAAPTIATLALYPLFALVTFVFYQVLIAADKTRYVGAMHMVGAAFSVGLNFALIPKFGAQGAAIATVASYFFLMLAMAIPGAKRVQIVPRYLKLPKMIFASAIVGALLLFIHPAGAAGKISVLVLAMLLYLTLSLIFKIFGQKELGILRKVLPKSLAPVVSYLSNL